MPKKTINDYTFYKIVNINGDVELCYVGSTVDMKQRRRAHKSNCHNENISQYKLKLYETIREHGGWDEFKMIVIGTADKLTLKEAHFIEEKYRVELRADLNTRKCFRTDEECGSSAYYQQNKEVLTEKNKVYRQNNIDILKQKSEAKEICECGCKIRHSEIAGHRKTQKHINLMLNIFECKGAKIICDCGCEITKSNIQAHRKSQKHINLMLKNNNI